MTDTLLPLNAVISWNTKKEANGEYAYTVYRVEHNKFTTLRESSGFKTRAIATARAKARYNHIKDCIRRQLAFPAL